MLTIDREKAQNYFAQRYAQTPKLYGFEAESCPHITPRFRIKQGSKVIGIGGCFTRRIEWLLSNQGFNIPWKRFVVPANEIYGGSSQLIHKHTPAAVFEEISWAVNLIESGKQPQFDDCKQFALESEDGRVMDVALAGLSTVTAERFVERRVQLFDILQELSTCDCLLLPFSEAESWFDTVNQICVYHTPHEKDLLEPRYVYRVFDYWECLDYAERTLALVRKMNPECRVLLSVSPNRMRFTATGEDVVLATENSKAVLRAVCSELCRRHDFVDYAPFYELVSGKGCPVLKADGIHITDAAERRAVNALLPHYFEIEGHYLLFKQAQTSVWRYHSAEIPPAEELEEALWLVGNALDLRPDMAEYLRLKAHVLNMQGKCGEAENLLRELLQRTPGDMVSLSMLGNVLVNEGCIDDGLRLIAEAVEQAKGSVECRLNYALALAKTGHLEESEQQYRTAIGLAPSFVWPWAALAEILLQAGRADDALAAASTAVQMESGSVKYNNLYARILLEMGRKAAAREALRKAVTSNIASSETLSLLSAVERSLGNLDEALLNAALAVRLLPSDYELRRKYAALLTDAGRLEEAEAELAKANEAESL